MIAEIAITGSLLKRSPDDIPQLMTVIEAEDLIRSGATNPEQILQQITQNQTESVSNVTIGRFTAGGTYANLRSLGSARTLVLVNGKRIVNGPYQSIGVNLNTVPTALLERVEVLANGGSATYGTDAVAGVVNFITAKELTGLNVSATATTPEKADGGEAYVTNFSGGAGSLTSDGWNLYGGATWRKAKELLATDRSFANTGFNPSHGIDGTQSRTPIANYSQRQTGITAVNPANPGCAGAFMLFADGAYGPQSCAYDPTARQDLITPHEQWSVFGKGSLKVGENHTASIEYIRGDSRLGLVVSPSGPSGLLMTSNNPYFPGQGITPGVTGLDPTLPIRVDWRAEELGRRRSEARSYADRALATLEGRFGAWSYQVSAMTSRSTLNLVLTNGYIDESRIDDGFTGDNGAPFLNPFGSQTAAGLQFLQDVEVLGKAQEAKGNLDVFGAQFNRELFKLPGGPVAFAAAVEFKKESARYTNNTAVTSLVSATFPGVTDIEGDHNSYSVSMEANLPVLDTLYVGVGARYDHYSDFGSSTNPSLSLRWEPLKWLALRGSYSTTFRAPTLYNVFQPRTRFYFNDLFDDPVLCPGGVVAAGGIEARDCGAGIDTFVGGNQKLKPESGNTHSLGVQLNPLESFSIGVDYWSYRVKNTIGQFSGAAIFADPAKYAAFIVRCSQVSAAEADLHESCTFGGGGDPIAYVENLFQNLGETRTSGFDLTASWLGPETALGQFGIQYRSTYVSKYEFQREPGGEFFSRAGRYIDGSTVLRYAHFLTGSWQRDAWTVQLTHRYRSSYADCNAECDIDPEFFNTVDAFQVFDLSAMYRWNRNVTFTATIGNLFNQAPPFTNGSSGLSVNWDDRYADPRLRTYLMTVSWKL